MENGRIERERRQSETERKQEDKILLSLGDSVSCDEIGCRERKTA